MPCGTIANSGGEDEDEHTYQLGASSGVMHFHWRTFSVKDRIIITYDGVELWDECVSSQDPGGGGNGPYISNSFPYDGNSTQVTVRVIPHCDSSQAGTETLWSYYMDCP